MNAKQMSKPEEIQAEISRKYAGKLVCELPDFEFDCGGLVWELSRLCGHHSGRATVGGLGLWNTPACNLWKALR